MVDTLLPYTHLINISRAVRIRCLTQLQKNRNWLALIITVLKLHLINFSLLAEMPTSTSVDWERRALPFPSLHSPHLRV